MKRGNYLSYQFFERIEHKSELAFFLNKIFKELYLLRMVCAPQIFNEDVKIGEEMGKKHKKRVTENAKRFYETCLFEIYAHALIPKIEMWITSISEYLEEYNGSWEFYARAKRLELIDKYGGNDDDYNEDNTIKTDVSNDVLFAYSIIDDIVQDDWRDTIIQTKPDDLDYIYRSIMINGSFSISDIFKSMGCDKIKSYRSENGQMIENTEDDELLHQLETQNKNEKDVAMLYIIIHLVSTIISETRDLQKGNDNKEYFENLRTRLLKLLDLDILDEIKTLIPN